VSRVVVTLEEWGLTFRPQLDDSKALPEKEPLGEKKLK